MSTLPTHLLVRVIASNGKFLGADVGGAQVTISDPATGEILASGLTQGGSGDLKGIMLTPRTRGTPIPTDTASAFKVTLQLDRPRLLAFTARGPLGGLQSMQQTTVTQWVIPGVDLTQGDGVLLTLSGLLVQVLGPATHSSLGSPGDTVEFNANVTMMCGCPISDGAVPLWNPGNFQVGVQIWLDGNLVDHFPLTFSGKTSLFTGNWKCKGPGFYSAVVYALEKNSGNSGCGVVTFFYQAP